MTILEILTDSLKATTSGISSGNSFWLYSEIVLISCVIIYQFIHSRNVFLSIEELKKIFENRIVIKNGFIEKDNLDKKEKSLADIKFNERDFDNENDYYQDQKIVKISIADTTGQGISRQICDDINNYLINNYGADINFSNIKDIIDRQIEVKDNEISQSINTPLYLGLAATMIGIIFGLFAMPELNNENFNKGIESLLNGVKLAMFASLFGLICTSYLSVIKYKNANKKLLKDKNEQISYLQSKLLPAIVDANQTGLQGLKTQMQQFSRDAFKISSDLKDTSTQTAINLEKIENITKNQLEIVNKIDTLDVTKISKTNLELFDKLERNVQSFNQFANYLDLMGRISNQLQDFASRTANIERLSTHIEKTILDNKELGQFLSIHFHKLDNAGNAALNAVNIADSDFRDAIENLKYNTENALDDLYKSITESSSKFAEAIDKLNTEIQTRIEKINQNTSDYESKLYEIYNDIGIKLKTITDEHIQQLNSTFKDSIPKFDELKHLTELPLIREEIKGNSNSNKFIEVVEDLNKSMLKVEKNTDQQDLLNKLSSIEEVLRKRRSEAPKPINKENNSKIKETEIKPVSFFEAITRLFKN